MPKEALATTLHELSSLLAGMHENEALNVPHLQELRGQLAASIEAIKSLAAEQAWLQGRRQAVTQQLRITRRKTQDIVVAARGGDPSATRPPQRGPGPLQHQADPAPLAGEVRRDRHRFLSPSGPPRSRRPDAPAIHSLSRSHASRARDGTGKCQDRRRRHPGERRFS